MKKIKFKLEVWYPGLPKEWEIGDIVEPDVNNYYSVANKNGVVHISHVLESRYWKEIIEKDYEILSFRYKDNPEIYSVKRLSDGEIFTIGDYATSKFYSGAEKIESFSIVGKTIRIHTDILYIYLDNCVKKKYKTTTEDGVKLFVGDKYWFISLFTPYKVLENIVSKDADFSKLHKEYKRFSTEKLATEYLNTRKIVLTTEDGRDLPKGAACFSYNIKYGRISSYMIQNLDILEVDKKYYKFFSTREIAEFYRVSVVKELCLNDIVEFVTKDDVTMDTLIERVKQRLKDK